MKCIEDEIPFDIPNGWSWCRFSSAFIINPRNQLSDDMSVSFVPMPLIQEGYVNKHTDEEKIWGSVKSGFTHFANNDVGVAKITPCFENKKSVVFKGLKNGYGAGTTELHIIRTIDNLIYPEYVLWNVKTDNFISNGIKAFSGAVGQKRIGKDFIEKSLIPTAPTNEQKRILECISIAFEYIDSIEASKEAFKVDIQSVKSKILDLAIRGKLVPQNPDDEPASILLERIRAEKEDLIKQGKIKRDKKESFIFKGEDNSYYEKIGNNIICIDEEIPFNLPDSWSWCRLGLVSTIYGRIGFRGYTKDDLVPIGQGAITLSPSNIIDNKMNYNNATYISWHKYNESPEIQIKNGDILLVKTGSSYGKSAQVHNLPQEATINPQFVVLKEHRINAEYLCCFLKSAYAKEIFDSFVVGTAIPTFTQANLNSMLLPIPPLGEQHTIVKVVDNFFTNIDTIKQQLS